ncbi:protein ENHANCED DISEASE RESISTANCE 2-like [Senna tora]|uniref:Protein ENHANCED DISEASE RESISTANCE 2-like n=1 Tax=Senna tora TaxID=362788 RepID=A0A834U1N1_9FABA|nr:protein ENHANCED DISEASE RESISTANCE 2-like [Senna tora]
MCPTANNNTCRSSGADSTTVTRSKSGESASAPDWTSEVINGGSLRHVDLITGSDGWASPPAHLFSLRSKNYFTKRQKSPAGHYLLCPAGVDWLKSSAKLDNVLARPDNRVAHALRKAQAQGNSLKSFIFAVNLQIPGKDHHSAVFYFATEDPIPTGSLLHRFINGDDQFRNQRFKLVNRIVKGPWIVKKAVGNYGACCLLGKALTCKYHRGSNYLEIDVDIGSSAIANAVLHLALGFVTSVSVDMGFVVEAQTEEELPEKLIGGVRLCQMEMSSAAVVDARNAPSFTHGVGLAKGNHHQTGDYGGALISILGHEFSICISQDGIVIRREKDAVPRPMMPSTTPKSKSWLNWLHPNTMPFKVLFGVRDNVSLARNPWIGLVLRGRTCNVGVSGRFRRIEDGVDLAIATTKTGSALSP